MNVLYYAQELWRQETGMSKEIQIPRDVKSWFIEDPEDVEEGTIFILSDGKWSDEWRFEGIDDDGSLAFRDIHTGLSTNKTLDEWNDFEAKQVIKVTIPEENR